ncbi:MAG TPA: hypothetical protein VFL96_01630 [Acidobacteriaceae bacterium]|nr:hypothetical protein [Acidobacteriaceae bacterium]
MSCRTFAVLIGAAIVIPVSFASTNPLQADTGAKSDKAAVSILPPPPSGTATVMGGVIRDLDPVRDQFKLDVFGGGKPVKVLFDARTRIFRDGKPVKVRDLHTNDHASVETTLDGDNIYALSIHMLSKAPEGQMQGQVLDFDPGKGIATLAAALSSQPIKLYIPPNTPIARVGQTHFTAARSGAAQLEPGDLISAKFTSGDDGNGVAQQISILATPGSTFIFSGNITDLDMHSGLLVITDPRYNDTYSLYFNPLVFRDADLHTGDSVRVSARFNGKRYEVSTIAPVEQK